MKDKEVRTNEKQDQLNSSVTSANDFLDQSQQTKASSSRSHKKPKLVYKLRRAIFRIFILFSALVMLACSFYTIYGLLWVKLF